MILSCTNQKKHYIILIKFIRVIFLKCFLFRNILKKFKLFFNIKILKRYKNIKKLIFKKILFS